MLQTEEAELPLFAFDLEGVETPLVVCCSIIGQFKIVKLRIFQYWSVYLVSVRIFLVAGLAKIGYNHAEAYQNKYTKSIPECCLLIFLGVIAGETYFLIHKEHLGYSVIQLAVG